MSALSDRMNLLTNALASFAGFRNVTRDLLDFAQRNPTALKQGVYTVIARTEGGFTNLLGRMAAYGTQNIVILGQIQLEETDTPSKVEDAEGDMIDEIKEFCRSQLPSGIGSLSLTAITQSQQIDYPYGWVLFELTMSEETY